MTTKKSAVAALAVTAIMAACGENRAKAEADKLLEQAEAEFDNNQYDKALATIDSLRKVYPNAIETRKKALVMHQNIALKQAQADLAQTDSMMQAVMHNYNYQKAKVEKDKKELRATAEELQMLTLTKMKLDSLRVRFDVQCAKIKYIHKKQKENP